MVSEDFKVGDLVWAKMKGYPPWPGKIDERVLETKPPKNKKSYCVYFFGTKNFAWIIDENISPHSEDFLDNLSKKRSTAYQSAIEDLINCSKSNVKGKQSPKKEKCESSSKKSTVKVFKVISSSKKVGKKVLAGKAVRKIAKKRSLDNSSSAGHSKSTSPKSQRVIYADECSLEGNTPPGPSDDITEAEWNTKAVRNSVDNFFDEIEQGRPSSVLTADLVPYKTIGFIGLGHVGRAIVQAFLRFGFGVTVWNKTPYKCDTISEYGAKKAQSPADLIVACDITFCSVSDPDASKSLIFGERGILKGLEEAEKLGFRNRGYVEMTSVDPETSQEIAEAVGRKNGKYLEAPICGSSDDALNAQLIILTSGDRKLFLDCEPYFRVISKHAYYLSCEVGTGAKFGLVLNSFSGIMYAVAAECLSLVSRLGLSDEIFLDILDEGPLKGQNILEKCKKMIKYDFKTVTPLRHMQKILNFTLLIGNQLNQHMPVTAAANEVYKHARLLQYSDSDVSAVYQGVRQ